MKLSILYVNWNSANYTRESIASLRAFTQNLEYEIVVVDNASTDNSLEILCEIPGIKLICSKINIGFAAANNLAAEHSSGQYVLYLNPDTVLVNSAITRLVEYLELNPETGIVGCRQLNDDKTFQCSSVQGYPTILNQIADSEFLIRLFPNVRLWGMNTSKAAAATLPIEVEVVSGACLMIRRNIINQMGGLCADFFMYCEEVELCYRAAQNGWKTFHIPDAVIVHFGGKSSEQREDNTFADIVMRESIFTFFTKSKGLFYARCYRTALWHASLLRLAILFVARIVTFSKQRKKNLQHASRRWFRILKWCIGLESWAATLSQAREAQVSQVKSIDSIMTNTPSCN